MFETIEYNKCDKDELFIHLEGLSKHLSSLHVERSIVAQERNRTFYSAYARCPAPSVAAKERDAEFSSQDLDRELIGIDAQVNSATTLITLVMELISYV